MGSVLVHRLETVDDRDTQGAGNSRVQVRAKVLAFCEIGGRIRREDQIGIAGPDDSRLRNAIHDHILHDRQNQLDADLGTATGRDPSLRDAETLVGDGNAGRFDISRNTTGDVTRSERMVRSGAVFEDDGSKSWHGNTFLVNQDMIVTDILFQ